MRHLAATPGPCATPVLQALGLLVWRDAKPVINNVSLRLSPGECVVVLGDDWYSLRTLAQVVSGWRDPVAGQVWLQGDDDPGAVALVDASGEARPACSVAELVAMGLDLLAGDAPGPLQAHGHERVLTALQWLGLRPRAHSRCDRCDAETWLLALIGRALVQGASHLVLDEPALGLKPAAVVRLAQVLQRLCKAGLGVLLTSRNPQHARMLAPTVYQLRRGQLLPANPSSTAARRAARRCALPTEATP